MSITGWIHPSRDLRREERTVTAMASKLLAVPQRTDVVRLARRSAFVHRGPAGGYADWRHLERPDPDLAVVIDGRLSNRCLLDHQLFERCRPLCSDVEVLLHAYRTWGAGTAQFIDGAYGIAIWDNLARRLLLIRDRFGARTLFYARTHEGLIFASQATALLAYSPDTPPPGGVRHDHPIGAATSEVRAGELLRYELDQLSPQRYWSLEALPKPAVLPQPERPKCLGSVPARFDLTASGAQP